MKRNLWLVSLLLGASLITGGDLNAQNKKWEIRSGGNLMLNVAQDAKGPDGQQCVKLSFVLKDPSDLSSNKRWFNAKQRNGFTAEELKNAEGISFELAGDRATGWWVNPVLLESDGTAFNCCSPALQIMPLEFRRFQVKFSDMQNPRDKKRRIKPEKIVYFEFNGGGVPGNLFFRNLRLLPKKDLAGQFVNSRIQHTQYPDNMLTPDQEAVMEFRLNPLPAGIQNLEYEIRDYFGAIIAKGTLNPQENIRKIDLGKLPTGYYETRVFAVNAEGKRGAESVIRTSGAQEPGVYTFGVAAETPETVQKETAKYGMDSFYGIQNIRDRYGAALHTGAVWKAEFPRWGYQEGKGKPELNAEGLPLWLENALKQEKKPNYMLSICSFEHRPPGVPVWARVPRTDANKRGADPEAAKAYFRNYTRLNKHWYSHMPKRLYELTWEPNHTGKMFSKEPPFWTPQDTVNYYRDFAPVIREADPDAVILGPKQTMNMICLEKVFQLGLGKYIDAISLHLYSALPEESKIPEKLRSVREWGRKYSGKEFDIYNTEAGYHSLIDGVFVLKDQARRLIRYSLILQGEGVKAYLMFYLFDTALDNYGSFGMYFNTGNNYDPREIMPKPVVPAYSVAASLLRGAKARLNLRWIGPDVWGYDFLRNGEVILALWTPYRDKTITFPAGDVREITRIDMMGRETLLPVKNGIVSLTLTQDVIYLKGVDSKVWNGTLQGVQHDNSAAPLEVSRGETTMLALPDPANTTARTFGDLKASVRSGKLVIEVPDRIPAGVVPVILKNDAGETVQFVRINPILNIREVEVVQENGMLVLLVPIRNTASETLSAELKLTSANGVLEQKETFPGKSEKTIRFPVQKITETFNPQEPFTGTLQVTANDEIIQHELSFSFLSTFKGSKEKALFTNTLKLTGKGSSGKDDEAVIEFAQTPDALIVKVDSKDDIFHQEQSPADLWKNDGIQLAFDTDPTCTVEYDPLTGRTSKKVTQLGAALIKGIPRVYRWVSFDTGILKAGDIITSDIPCRITRTPDGITHYELTIPWKQIGIESPAEIPNKKLGFALLINDSDGEKKPREILKLFDGIHDGTGWKHFGILNLQ